MSAGDKLPVKRRTYCEALEGVAKGLNWLAAWHAGYAGSNTPIAELTQKQKDSLTREAWRLRENPNVQAYIAELRATKARKRAQQAMERAQQAMEGHRAAMQHLGRETARSTHRAGRFDAPLSAALSLDPGNANAGARRSASDRLFQNMALLQIQLAEGCQHPANLC